MHRLFAIAMIASAAQACVLDDADGLMSEDTLLVPADVELHWDSSFNAVDDGLGAVVPVDVMVYDGATGEPRRGVQVDLFSSAETLLLTEPELSRVEPEACADCVVFWDAWRDQYYALDNDLYESEEASARVLTDSEGIARVYVLVDALEADDGGFLPVGVRVETRVADGTFQLIPR